MSERAVTHRFNEHTRVHVFRFREFEQYTQAIEWCQEQYGSPNIYMGRWTSGGFSIYLEGDNEALHFKMRFM